LYDFVHFACSLCEQKNYRLVYAIWYYGKLMTCEWFPKDLNENLNFKFISMFAVIHVNVAFLQIQIWLC
jgi:hypothetical protein